MILGRPTNLWLGFITAVIGLGSLLAVTVGHYDPTTVATLSGAVGVVFGAAIGLIAGQPPTVNSGDTVNVVTPPGQDNKQVTVA